ncbi:hypothetical protein AWB82_01471 [Caballeronia glebae]|uniref:Uncharacterized protein n=1 Tax=Caballeronia glebae TaxID=1777143 RepID=A0A157ZYZ2_9BURK|nr:hypothetical protein AWB82_01471 [Caballeronia glebae]
MALAPTDYVRAAYTEDRGECGSDWTSLRRRVCGAFVDSDRTGRPLRLGRRRDHCRLCAYIGAARNIRVDTRFGISRRHVEFAHDGDVGAGGVAAASRLSGGDHGGAVARLHRTERYVGARVARTSTVPAEPDATPRCRVRAGTAADLSGRDRQWHGNDGLCVAAVCVRARVARAFAARLRARAASHADSLRGRVLSGFRAWLDGPVLPAGSAARHSNVRLARALFSAADDLEILGLRGAVAEYDSGQASSALQQKRLGWRIGKAARAQGSSW